MTANVKAYPEYQAAGPPLRLEETSADIPPIEKESNGPLDNLTRGPVK